MKTSVGKGIEVVDEPYPELQPGYVIMRVRAAGICGSDLHTYERVSNPQSQTSQLRPIGHEGSGEIVEVGRGVEDWQVGDRVTFNPFTAKDNRFCGRCEYCISGNPLGCSQRHLTTRGGVMSEYTAVRADALYKLPEHMSYESGALCEPFAVALSAVDDVARFSPGKSATILGPGPIGLCTLLALKMMSPSLTVVTGRSVDRFPRLEMARRLGADITVDVDAEDVYEVVKTVTRGHGVDFVFEAVGTPLLQQGLRLLKFRGKYVGIGHPSGTDNLEFRSIPFSFDDYLKMQYKRLSIIGHWIYDSSTWVNMMKILDAKKVDLAPLVTHKLPLTEAEKAFQLALRKECVKVLLIP
ncbi:MAG: zinc-binding dehydrogenase [Candidatus Bathyarchaeia archaeon]